MVIVEPQCAVFHETTLTPTTDTRVYEPPHQIGHHRSVSG
jgi:hypothetical protein